MLMMLYATGLRRAELWAPEHEGSYRRTAVNIGDLR
jgi:hypothetical protein